MDYKKEHELLSVLQQYVCFAKQLEFSVRLTYKPSEDTIFRDFSTKHLDRSGTIDFNEKKYTWHFIGNGITFLKEDGFRFHYNVHSANEFSFSITFHPKYIIEYLQYNNI